MNIRQRLHSVALVGMDGSGKSTQSTLLREALTQQGARVVLIHPFGRKLLSIIPSRLTPQPATERPSSRPSPLARIAALAELIDIGLYLWAVAGVCWVLALIGRQDVWLVSDRSFDDLLVKHTRRGTLGRAVRSIVRKLVPTADTTIWLQTEPSVAMERDHDFQAAYYEELYALYQATAAEYGWQIVPTAGLSPHAVSASVVERLGLTTFQWTRERVVGQGTIRQ